MINWQEMGKLHVICKLQEILGKWFNIEVIFSDMNYKVRSHHLDKDYQFKNHFLKVQIAQQFGSDRLLQDIEAVSEKLLESDASLMEYESVIPCVKGLASKVIVDHECLGFVFAYPYVKDSITTEEISEIIQNLTKLGASEENSKAAVSHLKKMRTTEGDHSRDLIELVAEEVATFHEEITKREERIHELNSELGDKYRYHSMIGKSKKMQVIYNLLEKISNSESSIFIQGENGTGKELVAKAAHYNSPRKDNVFLAVNCSAFNDNLLDSELFGHMKGAFTGAIKDKKGLFEQANGGTLFLDEIGDTSLSMQVKLLRVLQEGTYLPVGATVPKKCDVRIVCATNKNIKEMMANKEFREDLFYRINVINITLPPLRDRKEDIHILIEHFLQKKCAESGMAPKRLSKNTLEKIMDYMWPGNVRELENEIERLVVLAGSEQIITPDHLSPRIIDSVTPVSASGNRGIDTNGNLKDALEDLEAIMIREGLKRCNFNKSKLAKELGISRASLIMKVEKYELDKRKKMAI
ncbi:MAG: hypothetical protein A2381_09660 [Bdellovibrionales bacterium RIFOXYB1_FULL_37_110]|nr:MAG: hypothetical protein A2181_02740 [Bdellovibrionales bacterium RIFOXYA1_FULL_38_20]OFZ47215.1 MAG: hypothetical protein A2417_06860 [Bdellovibrionales bacterium RIFOXYC1_FULL_37_79]OFZ59535.1 MAG: hypothetical protein A2381_09660 [Bdellovibrionales bacterium RIFOXYB1_FULL_37_110]OFZ62486.1 MAG: hypothetical protein A2577_03595 [Bdellovibrionales bacterium RIFOXYD1_FULL_36_51]